MSSRSEWVRRIAGSSAVVLFPLVAAALINPEFTPIHLVAQSETILAARVKGGKIADRVDLAVTSVLKGKAPAALSIDLSKAGPQHADLARKHLSALAGRPALLFVGGRRGAGAGFLHARGTWLRLRGGKGGTWRFEGVDQDMPAVWAGGTDMLMRCVRYIQAHPAGASVPVSAGTGWRAVRKIGSVGGEARDLGAVDLIGDGKLCLFVAGRKGDRLLRPAKGAFEDVTEKVKLSSASRRAAWGDFNADGRMDLASWDGKALTIWSQAADGSFSAVRPRGTLALPANVVGLAALGVASARMPGLLVSGAAGRAVLLRPTGKNAFEAAALPGPAGAVKDRGKAQACLVADLNGDSLIDVVQPFERGGLVYWARKRGGFDAAKPCAVCCTTGGGRADLGDFDGDGLLDVLVAGAEGARIFQNLGKGAFEESLALSGEVAYKGQPFASWCGVGDFNNDSRRDLLLTYRNQPAWLYFNRGFRSFGQAPKLALALEEIPDYRKGQQMGLLADFGGTGAQDLIVVADNGDLWCAFNELGGQGARCVKVRLPARPATPGPLTVSLWRLRRCLGADVLRAGGPAAFFGVEEAGPYTLKWRLPGGKEASRRIVVQGKPTTVVLEAAK